jgi:hypothetical protein
MKNAAQPTANRMAPATMRLTAGLLTPTTIIPTATATATTAMVQAQKGGGPVVKNWPVAVTRLSVTEGVLMAKPGNSSSWSVVTAGSSAGSLGPGDRCRSVRVAVVSAVIRTLVNPIFNSPGSPCSDSGDISSDAYAPRKTARAANGLLSRLP